MCSEQETTLLLLRDRGHSCEAHGVGDWSVFQVNDGGGLTRMVVGQVPGKCGFRLCFSHGMLE